MSLQQRYWVLLGGSACLLAVGVLLGPSGDRAARAQERTATGAEPAVADPALERARQQVRMLDDLYKTAVVSITKTYVSKQDDRPAIMIAKDVFGAMQKRGWHSARLVDATGEPLNDRNAPRTDFEKEAYGRIRSGQPYFDRVIGEGNGRRLMAATVVPVVLPKCTECHENKKVGEVLGFLRYDIPIK